MGWEVLPPNYGNKREISIPPKSNTVLEGITLKQVYQPIVDHAHGEVCGFEALSRPVRGDSFIAPDVWFRTAYDQGQNDETDLLVLHHALTTRSMFPQSCVPVFVNVSPRSFLDPTFYTELVHQFGRMPLRPNDLVLEIVEYVLYNPEELLLAMRRIQSIGVRVAVDDLGQGTADWDTVRLLNPDFVKVDRSYIDGISTSPSRQKFVSAALSQVGPTRLIVEGIEVEDDLHMVQELGVELGQGYFWSEPREADEWATLLLQIRLKREQLFRTADKCRGDLTHHDVLEQSKQLYQLLNTYYRRQQERTDIEVRSGR